MIFFSIDPAIEVFDNSKEFQETNLRGLEDRKYIFINLVNNNKSVNVISQMVEYSQKSRSVSCNRLQ